MMVFGGSEPEFGVISPSNDLKFVKTDHVHSYLSPNNRHLRVDFTGKKIGFTPAKKDALTFSMKAKRLEIDSLDAPNFTDNTGDIHINFWNESDEVLLNKKKLNFLEEFEKTYAIDIFQNTAIVFETDWNVYSLDGSGNLLWKTPVQSTAYAVNVSGNGNTVAVAYGNGTIRWYRMVDGVEILTLYIHPDNARWLA